MIRKIFLFIVLFLISFLSFTQSFEIETSKGIVKLVVPENLSIEEAYQQIAQMYLEERYDLQESLDIIDSLNKEIDEYIEKVSDYIEKVDNLNLEKDELIKLLEEKNKPKFISPFLLIGGGVEDINPYSLFVDIQAGIILFERWTLTTILEFPFRIGIGGGIIF